MLKAKITRIIKNKIGLTVVADIVDELTNTVVIPAFNIPIEEPINKDNYRNIIEKHVNDTLDLLIRKKKKVDLSNFDSVDVDSLVGNEIKHVPDKVTYKKRENFVIKKMNEAESFLQNLDFSQPVDLELVVKNILSFLGINYRE